jgi:hypothetical protein
MKRNYKTTIGGKQLTLSLSFATSLDLLDNVGSPSEMLLDVIADEAARTAGKSASTRFKLTERTAVKLLEIANAKDEAMSFGDIGDLCFDQGFLEVYGIIVDYLTMMISGGEQERPDLAEFVEDSGEDTVAGKN